MASNTTLKLLAATALIALGSTAALHAQQAGMSFFLTSAGKGDGANLGGLAGADAHCAALAKAAGATGTNWRPISPPPRPVAMPASTPATASARDHGRTPRAWSSPRASMTCTAETNNLKKDTALTEKGETVSGRGDPVNMHDVLTGSDPEAVTRLPAATPTAATGPRTATARRSSVITTAWASRTRVT